MMTQEEKNNSVQNDCAAVRYAPGNEPEKIRQRLDRLFEKLDAAYPDKKISGLYKNHKEWGKTVTELYRLLGYANGNAFLEAYGYTVVENSGGRPAMDHMAIINELKARYPGGATCSRIKELTAENPDLSSRINTLNQKSNQYFGMQLLPYLIKEGLIIGMTDEQREEVMQTLRLRYADGPFDGTLKALTDANSDVDWTAVHRYHEDNKPDLTFNAFLVEQGILKARETKEWDSRTAAENIVWITDELRKRYPAQGKYHGTVVQLGADNPDLPVALLSGWTEKTYLETAVQYLIRIGFMVSPEEEQEQIKEQIAQITEELKKRYASTDNSFLTIAQMERNNPDLQVRLIDNWVKKLYGLSTTDYFVQQGILQEKEPTIISVTEEDISFFKEYMKSYAEYKETIKPEKKPVLEGTVETLLAKAKAEYDRLKGELEAAVDTYVGGYGWPETDDASVWFAVRKDERMDPVFEALCQYAGSKSEYWSATHLSDFLKDDLHRGTMPYSFGGFEPVCVVLAMALVFGKLNTAEMMFYHGKWEERGDYQYDSHIRIWCKNHTAQVIACDDDDFESLVRESAEENADVTDNTEEQITDDTPAGAFAVDFTTKRSSDRWMEEFGDYVTPKTQIEIEIEGKSFVLSGITDFYCAEGKPYIAKAIYARGGFVKAKVSGKTDYLVVNPRFAGVSKATRAVEEKQKGKNVQIILLNDLLDYFLKEKLDNSQ